MEIIDKAHEELPMRKIGNVHMHPTDFVKLLCEAETLASFTTRELMEVYSAINAELTFREQP